MEHSLQKPEHEPDDERDKGLEEVEVDSVTLARLLAEVRNEDTFDSRTYNRMHNRHNR